MQVSKTRNILSIVLIIVGCIQMVGFVMKNKVLYGLGLSYGVSPLATVFSTVEGVEGFSTRHQLIYKNGKGEEQCITMDQKFFSKFRGSYFLQNSLSIFLAYPHILKPDQVAAGENFLLCNETLPSHFGITEEINNPIIQTTRIIYGRAETLKRSPSCSQ